MIDAEATTKLKLRKIKTHRFMWKTLAGKTTGNGEVKSIVKFNDYKRWLKK